MNLQPYHDNLIVRIEKKEVQLQSGIVLPDDTSAFIPNIVTVLAVGPGYHAQDGSMVPTTTKPGDRALVPKSVGQVVYMDDEPALVVRERDLIAKVV